MSSIPHGYTVLEVLAAGMICLLFAGLIVLFANPALRLDRARDDRRLMEARDIMEDLLDAEMKQSGAITALNAAYEGDDCFERKVGAKTVPEGYYLKQEGSLVIVGACKPLRREKIEITADLSQIVSP